MGYAKLAKSQEFQSVFKSRKRSIDRAFLVIARENTDGLARLGMAISSKRLKRAIDRNKAKRVIRESFSAAQHRLKGLDVVVVLRRINPNRENRLFRKILEKHWEKIAPCKRSY